MKVTTPEVGGCFSIELQAENLEEAALLTRFGMNATRQLNHFSASADEKGKFSLHAVFAKGKNAGNDIPNRYRKREGA